MTLTSAEQDWIASSPARCLCGHLVIFHNDHCCQFCMVEGCGCQSAGLEVAANLWEYTLIWPGEAPAICHPKSRYHCACSHNLEHHAIIDTQAKCSECPCTVPLDRL